jgi:hypothetical protein
MPKNKKTGKRAVDAAAQTADDDFDDMLAEVMAADPVSPATTYFGSASSSSSSSGNISMTNSTCSSSADPAATVRTDTRTTEPTDAQQKAIIQCCVHGDIPKLRQWARRGVRVVFSASPLIAAAGYGMLEVVRYLVKEAGADINHAEEHGRTPLYAAAQFGRLAVVLCLAKELGADVNQANQKGITPLYIAA